MYQQICETKQEVKAFLNGLKLTACPHCKQVGYLNRHGVLRANGNDSVRAYRAFCSNRYQANGCGRTFSIWTADKIKRLFLDAQSLWDSLHQVVVEGSKRRAFQNLRNDLSDSTPYRIWKRFSLAQSKIRTALYSLCKPPKINSDLPEAHTLAHLKLAFSQHRLNPIAAFQATLQTFLA